MEFPHDNISFSLKIKHFIPQKIVDKSTVDKSLSNKQSLSCIYVLKES